MKLLYTKSVPNYFLTVIESVSLCEYTTDFLIIQPFSTFCNKKTTFCNKKTTFCK